LSWAPEIEAVIVKNNELAPQAGGEPAITPTGAVLANAVFDATGARLHRLPMTRGRVRRAITERVVQAQPGPGSAPTMSGHG